MLDELHLLGKTHYAGKVIRQIRGGLDKTPEGKFLITTTESDDIPAGAFKDELHNARKHRDGEFRGKEARPTLPVLYEFPRTSPRTRRSGRTRPTGRWCMPNLGRSVHLQPDPGLEFREGQGRPGDPRLGLAVSQHRDGRRHEDRRLARRRVLGEAEDETITLETMLERCEVIVPASTAAASTISSA
jgi:hypothetical protein